MTTTDLPWSGDVVRRRVLEDARRRLFAVASTLTDERSDAATLRRRAADLEGVAQRLRWVVDVFAADPEVTP